MKELLTYWQFDGTSIAILLVVAAWMFFMQAFSRRAAGLAVLALLVLCLFSPLSVLGGHYLFSAHMSVHVLLLLAVGPLLVCCLPANGKRGKRFFLFLRKHPIAAWLAGIGMMWIWHVPILFNTAMAASHHSSFSIVHVVESLSLIGAGIVFSLPVIYPDKNYRLDSLSGVVYLFTACVGCSLLGLLITFAPAGTYRHFLMGHDEVNGFLLRSGMDRATDQQAAGLIMWVPCCFIYVSGAMYLLAQWFKQKEDTVAYAE